MKEVSYDFKPKYIYPNADCRYPKTDFKFVLASYKIDLKHGKNDASVRRAVVNVKKINFASF